MHLRSEFIFTKNEKGWGTGIVKTACGIENAMLTTHDIQEVDCPRCLSTDIGVDEMQRSVTMYEAENSRSSVVV